MKKKQSYSEYKKELEGILEILSDSSLSFEEICELHNKGLAIINILEHKLEEQNEVITKTINLDS